MNHEWRVDRWAVGFLLVLFVLLVSSLVVSPMTPAGPGHWADGQLPPDPGQHGILQVSKAKTLTVSTGTQGTFTTLTIATGSSIYVFVDLSEFGTGTNVVAGINDSAHDVFTQIGSSISPNQEGISVWKNDSPGAFVNERLTVNTTVSGPFVASWLDINGQQNHQSTDGSAFHGGSAIPLYFATVQTTYIQDLVLMGVSVNFTQAGTVTLGGKSGAGNTTTANIGSIPNRMLGGVVNMTAGSPTPSFSVYANNSQGASTSYVAGIVSIIPSVPDKVTGISAGSITSTSFVASWTNPKGNLTNVSIAVGHSSSPGNTGPQQFLGVVTSALITNVTATGAAFIPGQVYCFNLHAWNSTGESAASGNTNVTLLLVPQAPTNLVVSSITITPTTASVTLTWTQPPGTITNDSAYWGTAAGVYTHFVSLGVAVTYTLSGVASGVTYYFAVAGWNASGQGAFATIAVSTAHVPPAPTGLSLSSPTGATIAASWTDPKNITNVSIAAGIACPSVTAGFGIGPTATSWTINGLVQKTTYCVVVWAWNATGSSPGLYGNFTTVTGVATFFLSSAPPTGYVGENITYVIQASLLVNWTLLSAPSGFTLRHYLLAAFATLNGNFTSAGVKTFSVFILSTSGGRAWQNWTTVVKSYPFIYGNPYMTPAIGQAYDYLPNGSTRAGTYSFSGAPYLSVVSAATGEVAGTVTSGTYLNALTLNTSTGNFTQYWITTTGVAPSSVSFNCYIGHHSVAATLNLSDGFAAGCGNLGIFTGQYVLWQASVVSNNAPFAFSNYFAGSGYIAELRSNVTTSGSILWFYGSPGTTTTNIVNTAAVGSSYTVPSSGFSNISFSPPFLPPIGCVGSACNNGTGGYPTPTGLTVTSTSSTSVSLAWSVGGLNASDFYIVYGLLPAATSVCGSPNTLGLTIDTKTTSTTYRVSGLSPSTAYCFAVEAIYPPGILSSPSSVVKGTTASASSAISLPAWLQNIVWVAIGIALIALGILVIVFTRRLGVGIIVSVLGTVVLILAYFF